jgi:hypothetical protein
LYRSKLKKWKTAYVTTVHGETIERDEHKRPAAAHQIDEDRPALGVELHDFAVENGVISVSLPPASKKSNRANGFEAS